MPLHKNLFFIQSIYSLRNPTKKSIIHIRSTVCVFTEFYTLHRYSCLMQHNFHLQNNNRVTWVCKLYTIDLSPSHRNGFRTFKHFIPTMHHFHFRTHESVPVISKLLLNLRYALNRTENCTGTIVLLYFSDYKMLR